jgi:hypothetical protein
MGFLATLRERLTEAVHHHPAMRTDPMFGQLEQAGVGLWQTTQPLPLADGSGPVTVMIEGEAGPDATARDAFEELGRRYSGLKASIGPMLCKTAPRVRAKCLWEHASLSSVEIWREPRTNQPVFALEYELDDDPEYSYVVRVENWRAVDVLVVG